MSGRKKLRIRTWSAIFSTLLLISCTGNKSNVTTIHGETQGTTYTIILPDPVAEVSSAQIDSILKHFDMSLSTYIESSLISMMNNSRDSIAVTDTFNYVKTCYDKSYAIFKLTGGAFDPSVFPLVKGYGFMENLETPLSDEKIDSILQFVSFEKGKYYELVENGDHLKLVKFRPEFKMDFNAIAQGYSVDVLSDYLERRGFKDYYVEIGGEINVKGKNKDGVNWRIGIDLPIDSSADERKIENILSVTDKAVATSGNYRKFYIKDGRKYSHTLDPVSGKPVQHSLLSVTVIADDCTTADAMATAFMVVGTEKALQMISAHPELHLQAYFLEANDAGGYTRKMSSGFENFIAE